MSNMIMQISSTLERYKDLETVWVHGDTLSAFVGAICAFHAEINIAHVEAGLRTHDLTNPFPEEAYRQMIDRIAKYKFAPTPASIDNLYKENLVDTAWYDSSRCGTGNTVVDALEMIKPKLKGSNMTEQYVLVTMHRRESFGEKMRTALEAIKEISTEIKVVFPAHPNPLVRNMLKEVGIEYIEPVDYVTFLELLNDCEYVITDSGGTQEEAPSFGKRTIVLRTATERTEAVDAGISVIISKFDKDEILKIVTEFIHKPVKFDKNPFGDGHAAEYIKKMYDKEKSK
jgi:UDP-N-acetylglucosamine 2-epimerase (non-hydrolysing)